MRSEFCLALVGLSDQKDFIFLTGDLGYKALEPLRDAAGARFINAGIAEQNMVSVAAGMAKVGLLPWVYSIAPFLYARPFEQIRNDVCIHNLPVKLVGNGGGYGYGVMGATHHALEDYGVLLALPNLHAFIPAFNADVPGVVQRVWNSRAPAYLRLGYGEEPKGYAVPPFTPWRKLLDGGDTAPTMLVVGPLVGGIFDAVRQLGLSRRPNLWVLGELPITDFPQDFLDDLLRSGHLFVIEEHVAHGGAGEAIARELLVRGLAPRQFTHRAAKGYVSGLYGSQKFHRKECGLDPQSIVAALT